MREVEKSLFKMANNNIRFLQDANSLEEFKKIRLHSYHLQKVALKLKRKDIYKMIGDAIWNGIITSRDRQLESIREYRTQLKLRARKTTT